MNMNLKYLAAMVLATGLVSAAHAATTYTVLGTQGYSIDAVTGPDGIGAVLTYNPSPSTFNGTWSIDPVAPTLSGSFIFDPYAISLDMPGLGTIDISTPARVLTISGGSFSYDAGTRTLAASGVTFLESSPGITCTDTGEGLLCPFVPGPETPSHGSLTLTFAADLLSFTGSAYVHQGIAVFAPDPASSCIVEGGNNICANNLLTFSGVATVPVPAAGWLFGSALLGVAGLTRRKAA